MGRPTDEETPVDPSTPYAISKYDQERLVLTFGRETGLPTVALRYFVRDDSGHVSTGDVAVLPFQ